MNAPCPPAGSGVHSWILATANRCRNVRMEAGEAERFITDRMTRPPRPANEVRVALAKSYREPLTTRGPLSTRAPRPITEIEFDPAKLAAIAGRITPPRNWRHWLWERSPIQPEHAAGYAFLKYLYRPGEKVLVFDEFKTCHPVATIEIGDNMPQQIPQLLRRGGRYGLGIWYLSNPVDGQYHNTGTVHPKTGRKHFSCRDHHAITTFRYAVLESDDAPADQWLAFVAQMPARASAIYTSGGRSIHTLIRLDAPTKEAWDGIIDPMKRPLRVLGACSNCLSAVRLTRLPDCWRPEKAGFQKLLFLNPDPPLAPLLDLPVLATRADTLARFRQVCPRWAPGTEAFL